MTARFHPEARQELDDIAVNYELHGERLGDEFVDELQRGQNRVV